ncbi:uncharacterized protein PF3D7_1120000-like [Palaemon carinicauda]|uniref:uncharacterized protein PF3D7_1120000-like n=1 Tax=Palaemon carinicauda TaxID=392227 RepID=UPI0035B5F16D
MAERERSPLENKGKVRTLVMQYEERIEGDAKQTSNGKLKHKNSLRMRRNPIREAKDVALARIVAIQKFERSQNEEEIISRIKRKDHKPQEVIVADLVRKLEKTQTMAKKERSPLEKGKDMASAQLRKIVQEEMASEKRGLVSDLVKLYENAIKGDKIGEKNEYQEARKSQTENSIEYFENILREKTESEGDLLGQSPDFREHLNRKAKDIALARISQIIQDELSEEQNENVWKSENIEKDLQNYQDSNSPGTQGDFASKGDEYAEIMMVNGIRRKQTADLKGKFQDERKHLRREAKDLALIRIRQIAEEEISQQKSDKVNGPIQVLEEALKDEKKDKRQKVNLEKIEEGIVKRRIQYFENIIRGIVVSECCQAIKKGLQGVRAHEELLEQNESVWKSENIEKDLQTYQEANSPGTQGDSACSDEYEKIKMAKIMGRKQIADLRREAKDRAFLRIRRIAMEEVFPENRGLVYALVQRWEEALKDEKIEKIKKVIHEVIEEGIVKRHIKNFENVIRGNIKEGDLRVQSRVFTNHLRRTTKDIALAQIRQIVQEEMSEKRSLVYDLTELYENAIKGDKIEKKNEYKAIKSEILENLIEYFENILKENSENEGNLHGQSRDLGNHLRRAAKEVALVRIRNISQEVIKEENFEE